LFNSIDVSRALPLKLLDAQSSVRRMKLLNAHGLLVQLIHILSADDSDILTPRLDDHSVLGAGRLVVGYFCFALALNQAAADEQSTIQRTSPYKAVFATRHWLE
jgi:hypothetical protein